MARSLSRIFLKNSAQISASHNTFYASAAKAVSFRFVCPVALLSRCVSWCPVNSVFLSLRKNTEHVSMKFAGGNYCQSATDRLNDNILSEECRTDKVAGCDRKFKSTSAGVLSGCQTGADTWRMNSHISQHSMRQMRSRT